MARGSGRGGDKEGVAIMCGGCCFILFVIAAGLVGGSFRIVEPTEWALLQNTISREVTGNRVYASGRFFVGLARDFIRYPRTRRNLFFGTGSDADSPALSVPLSEGQVTFDVGMQYSLNRNNLSAIFRQFGTNFHTRFISAAASAIPAAMSGVLNVSDFITNRNRVSAIALGAVRAALTPLGAEVHDLQLRQITLPTVNQDTITNTLVSNQRARTATNEQIQRQINAQVTVVVGEIDQEISLYLFNQTQAASVVAQRAAATAKQLDLDSQATAYAAYGRTLGFNTSELLQYLYLRNMRNLRAGTLSLGFTANTLWAS